MIGIYQGVEFIVGTATVEQVEEPKPGFQVIGLDRKYMRVPLEAFLLWEGTEPMDKKEELFTELVRETAQQWADWFNGK